MTGYYSPCSSQHDSNIADPSLADPIFDLQPGFDFQDGQNDDTQKSAFHQGYRADQQDIFDPVDTNDSR